MGRGTRQLSNLCRSSAHRLGKPLEIETVLDLGIQIADASRGLTADLSYTLSRSEGNASDSGAFAESWTTLWNQDPL